MCGTAAKEQTERVRDVNIDFSANKYLPDTYVCVCVDARIDCTFTAVTATTKYQSPQLRTFLYVYAIIFSLKLSKIWMHVDFKFAYVNVQLSAHVILYMYAYNCKTIK